MKSDKKPEAPELSPERYREMLDAIPFGLALYRAQSDDPGELVLEYGNAVTSQLSGGIHLDELRGQTMRELFPSAMELPPEINGPLALQRAAVENESSIVEVNYPGDEFHEGGWLRIHSLPVSHKHSLAMYENITEQKRLQEENASYLKELERSNEELDQFAYAISHDLRAPMRGIKQLSSWIEEDAETLPDEVQSHIDKLQQKVTQMEKLLEDILQYARVGRQKELPETVDTEALLKDCVEMLSLSGKVHTSTTMPTIKTTSAPLRVVFLNLLGNAYQHHHAPEHCQIEVSATPQGGQWRFSVKDNGPGIATKHHERIFQMFQSLKANKKGKSTGMGLAIVKKTVEKQGGSISIDSAKGKGTTFSFTWPIAN